MAIQISYKKQINEKLIKNYVLFSDDGFKIHSLNEMTLGKKTSFIKEIIKKNESKKGKFLAFNINSIQRIILISLKKKTNSLENEKIGADFYNFIKSNSFFNSAIDNRSPILPDIPKTPSVITKIPPSVSSESFLALTNCFLRFSMSL